MGTTDFKERVASLACEYAPYFKELFIDREFLFYSEAFGADACEYMTADSFNYSHLLGIHSSIPNHKLFDMCMSGTLTANDFHFAHQQVDEITGKGYARRKMRALRYIDELLEDGVMVQANYRQASISGRFLLGTENVCLCCSYDNQRHPNSLLEPRGMMDREKCFPVDLILSRRKGTTMYDTIELGGPAELRKYRDKLPAVVSKEIEEKSKPKNKGRGKHWKRYR